MHPIARLTAAAALLLAACGGGADGTLEVECVAPASSGCSRSCSFAVDGGSHHSLTGGASESLSVAEGNHTIVGSAANVCQGSAPPPTTRTLTVFVAAGATVLRTL